jgi:hypothetical protein
MAVAVIVINVFIITPIVCPVSRYCAADDDRERPPLIFIVAAAVKVTATVVAVRTAVAIAPAIPVSAAIIAHFHIDYCIIVRRLGGHGAGARHCRRRFSKGYKRCGSQKGSEDGGINLFHDGFLQLQYTISYCQHPKENVWRIEWFPLVED